jgi:predicted RNA binding protein YcfA (HicA-like mRNA interferase family)
VLGCTGHQGKGSHAVFAKPGHPYIVTVPNHGRAPIKKGTLPGILRAAGVTVEECSCAPWAEGVGGFASGCAARNGLVGNGPPLTAAA